MSEQLEHNNSFFEFKKFPITLLLDNISGPANIGSIFRLSDAFSIEKIIICGKNININSNRLLKTARSTSQKINFELYEEATEAILTFVEQKYSIFALEITNDSKAIDTVNFSEIEKMVLIVGSEGFGIQKELLDFSNQKIHINMFGHNSSMNVAQATGIALYEITKSLPPIFQE